MPETPFIITVDTEGDNLWAGPREITTHNARFLPRFQALCERFRLKPVYLTNYEMATSDAFAELARDVVARGAGEIGMHLHAWNSPPLEPLTTDDFRYQPYLTEYPEPVMRRKVETLTAILEDRFCQEMVSHRGGRWAFDGRYASILLDAGYRVDCSVTPGVNWRASAGAPTGRGGPDYTAFPRRPYFLGASDISVPACRGLLEVPVTSRASDLYRAAPWLYDVRLVRRFASRAAPAVSLLSPVQPALRAPVNRHLEAMVGIARKARAERAPYLEFIVHSSELMPGGSPTFRSEADIERLYEHLELLFEEQSTWCYGATLAEFHGLFASSIAHRDHEGSYNVWPEAEGSA